MRINKVSCLHLLIKKRLHLKYKEDVLKKIIQFLYDYRDQS